ncbi:MAG: hypothetical protein GC137_00760 [Alphaproteobacteria bacterium]|nr:hypothetical protein [Alphaproteobacteria bacterium]
MKTKDLESKLFTVFARVSQAQGTGCVKTPEDAIADLEKRGVNQTARTKLLSGLETDDPRALAYYYFSHGIDHLDRASAQVDTTDDPETSAIKAIFQCSELCLYLIDSLARRTEKALQEGDFDRAFEHFGWMSSINQTLLRTSRLLPEISRTAPEQGSVEISLVDSPNLARTLATIERFHLAIVNAGLADSKDLVEKGLGDSGRNISFNALLDQNYQILWQLYLRKVRVPKIPGLDNPSSAEAYERLVAPEVVREALTATRAKGDNYLSEFHLYHQLSEVLAKPACLLVNRAAQSLMSDEPDLCTIADDLSNLTVLSRMLPENAVPLFRNLSQAEYARFRALLGITSGAQSPYIAKSLAGPAYTALMGVVQNFVVGKEEYSNEELKAAAEEVVRNRRRSPEDHMRYEIMRSAMLFADHVRHWRELHTQFPLVQFGLSNGGASAGVASLSGAPYGLSTAYTMSGRMHGEDDLAAVFYSSITGSGFPAYMSFEDRFSPETLGAMAEMLNAGAEMAQRAMVAANPRNMGTVLPQAAIPAHTPEAERAHSLQMEV